MSEEDNNNSNKQSKPVTVIVKRIAKKDKVKEFEEWLSGISKEISRQEGMMGIDILDQLLILRIVNLSLNMLLYLGLIVMRILKSGRDHQYEMNGYKKVEN